MAIPLPNRLREDNFKSGFLVDDEYLAGVSDDPERAGAFVAFVLRHTTGETVGYERHDSLVAALARLNSIPLAWTYESASSCGGGCRDGACSGVCASGGCGARGSTG